MCIRVLCSHINVNLCAHLLYLLHKKVSDSLDRTFHLPSAAPEFLTIIITRGRYSTICHGTPAFLSEVSLNNDSVLIISDIILIYAHQLKLKDKKIEVKG